MASPPPHETPAFGWVVRPVWSMQTRQQQRGIWARTRQSPLRALPLASAAYGGRERAGGLAWPDFQSTLRVIVMNHNLPLSPDLLAVSCFTIHDGSTRDPLT